MAESPSNTLLWNCFMGVVIIFFTVFCLKVLSKLRNFLGTLVKRMFALAMVVFTWFYNRAMYSKKKELFGSLKEHLNHVDGDLLEIGAGTGANFQFFPDGCSVLVLDPNEHMHNHLVHSKKYFPNIDVKEHIVNSAEDMSQIKDHTVSVVVATLVLCSVESVEQVLKEIVRVLKPGGRFYFLEHVKGKKWMLRFQQILNPCWYYIADGCRLTRDTERQIRKAGFKNIQCQAFDADNARHMWYNQYPNKSGFQHDIYIKKLTLFADYQLFFLQSSQYHIIEPSMQCHLINREFKSALKPLC